MSQRTDGYGIPIRQQLRGGHGSSRDMAVEITKEFALSARSIANGRVASARDFRLFDAIGAIEIGDPKMDSGLLLHSDVYMPIYDIARPLSRLELVYVFDIHIFYLMDWHKGMPLAQTLLASHYIDALLQYSNRPIDYFVGDPYTWYAGPDESYAIDNALDSAVLTLFCLGIAKLCGFAIDEFKHSEAPFYEDEDISLQTMGRDFFPLVTHEGLWTFGHETRKLIEGILQSPEAVYHKRTASSMLHALLDRVLLLMAIVGVMDSSVSPKRRDEQIAAAIAAIDRIVERQQTTPGHQVLGVFSPLLQHRSASTCPLRPLNQYNFTQAYDNLGDLMLGCQLELNGIDTVLASDSTYIIKRFLRQFPCRSNLAFPYVRAAVYSTFLGNTMKNLESQLLHDMAQFMPLEIFQSCISHDAPRLPRHDEEKMQWFSHHFVQKFYAQYHRALCANASRMRRLLCRSLYAICHLIDKACEIDQYIGEVITSALVQPIYLWCIIMKYDIIQHIVELGFELGIYLEHEYEPLYRFLVNTVSISQCSILAATNEMMRLGFKSAYDRMAYDRLLAIHNIRQADRFMLWAVHSMHVIAHKLDPRPSSLSATVQQRRWDIRMRPFWQAGIPVDTWKDLQEHQLLKFDQTGENASEKIKIAEAILQSIGLFRQAAGAYTINEAQAEERLLSRAYEDEYYREKKLLAEIAIKELETWLMAWKNDEPMSFDRSKITAKTDNGARLIYHIPGLLERKTAEDEPATG